MGQVCYQQFVHVLFVTKKLDHLILQGSQNNLYACINTMVKSRGGQCLAISGTTNHIHLLINLPTDVSISTFVGQVKACSSKWYSQQMVQPSFSWNTGYLAFTVSPEVVPMVKDYFSKENIRHDTISVEDEMCRFLQLQEINFDPQYLLTKGYTNLNYHLIWTVKDRLPLLDKSIQTALHENLRYEIEKMNGRLHAVGNVADHIHLVVECPKTLATADLVEKLKTTSTYFLRSQGLSKASWQKGYGVFSVSKSGLDGCIGYALDQEKHHAVLSLHDEWQRLLCRT